MIMRKVKNGEIHASLSTLRLRSNHHQEVQVVDSLIFDTGDLLLVYKDSGEAFLGALPYGDLDTAGNGQPVEHVDDLRHLIEQVSEFTRCARPSQSLPAYRSFLNAFHFQADRKVSTEIVIHRHRILNEPLKPRSSDQIQPISLSGNGRKGRRIACVLTGSGTSLTTFDMDVDEEEEEVEEEDVGMETEEVKEEDSENVQQVKMEVDE